MSCLTYQLGICRSMCTSTEVRFIEAFEPVTDLEDKFTEVTEPVTYLNTLVDNEVRFIEASEPVTEFEA